MNQVGILISVLALLSSAALSGCSPGKLEDPQTLLLARQASSGVALWDEDFGGLDAILRPESPPFGGFNLSLQAVYRKTGPDSVKFALFFPQGSKLGQCERNGLKTSCSNLPLPGASSFLRGSFAAIDEIFRLSPDEADSYELVLEDRGAGLKGENPLLRRRHKTSSGSYYVLSNLEGALLAAYKRGLTSGDQSPRSDGIRGWKAFFSVNRQEYRFVPRGGSPAMEVSITRWLKNNLKEHARNAKQGSLAPFDPGSN